MRVCNCGLQERIQMEVHAIGMHLISFRFSQMIDTIVKFIIKLFFFFSICDLYAFKIVRFSNGI